MRREQVAKFEARSLMEVICIAATRTEFATISEFDSLENNGIESAERIGDWPETRKLKKDERKLHTSSTDLLIWSETSPAALLSPPPTYLALAHSQYCDGSSSSGLRAGGGFNVDSGSRK
ncbi:hypothetical protein TorRG33x02_003420 [Trema orientale]|uniref:Uncharacterized protein n=1 Tax=Trema orientale TaxID=63057 RepID=A0A2P5G1U4_TREOI|nr:hypothetical protein TorRG33x02_003420 [Trema orientale]